MPKKSLENRKSSTIPLRKKLITMFPSGVEFSTNKKVIEIKNVSMWGKKNSNKFCLKKNVSVVEKNFKQIHIKKMFLLQKKTNSHKKIFPIKTYFLPLLFHKSNTYCNFISVFSLSNLSLSATILIYDSYKFNSFFAGGILYFKYCSSVSNTIRLVVGVTMLYM